MGSDAADRGQTLQRDPPETPTMSDKHGSNTSSTAYNVVPPWWARLSAGVISGCASIKGWQA